MTSEKRFPTLDHVTMTVELFVSSEILSGEFSSAFRNGEFISGMQLSSLPHSAFYWASSQHEGYKV